MNLKCQRIGNIIYFVVTINGQKYVQAKSLTLFPKFARPELNAQEILESIK